MLIYSTVGDHDIMLIHGRRAEGGILLYYSIAWAYSTIKESLYTMSKDNLSIILVIYTFYMFNQFTNLESFF
jgi:hypothetical protein